MAERNPPVWMQSGTYNAADDRAVTGLLVDRTMGASGALKGIQGGVVPGVDQVRATLSGNLSVTMSIGTVIVPGRSSEVPGAYVCHNQSPTVIEFPVTTGNPRWDLIVAEVEDVQAGHDENIWRLARVQGPVSSAGPPSVASVIDLNARMAVPLYWVKVVPAVSGQPSKINAADGLTDLRVYVASIGGVHITEAESPNPDHSPGRLVYSLGSDHLYISDGSSWQYFMTYQAWEKYFSAHRPGHASSQSAIIKPNQTDNWTASPDKDDNTDASNNIETVQVTGMTSPTGRFKVTLSGYGRTADSAGVALMGFSVHKGGSVEVNPNTGYRCLAFYGKEWSQSTIHVLQTGLQANTDYTFRVQFKKHAKNDNTVRFANGYIMVEPVL